MKNFNAVLVMGMLLFYGSNIAYCQDGIKRSAIDPYHLEIGYFKTSNLVFPYRIISVDKGSNDVLVQQAIGVKNILHVKAGKSNFEETNLSVITADGRLYSYILHYSNNPMPLNFRFTVDHVRDPEGQLGAGFTNQAVMKKGAEIITAKKRSIYGVKDKKHGIQLTLTGLFIEKETMYFQLNLKNKSNINYDIAQIRFFIIDQEKPKRTASQELEIKALYVHNGSRVVLGQGEHNFVFAHEKFTIPDKKHLIIQIMEKNGGRHVALQVPNRIIVKAKVLNPKL